MPYEGLDLLSPLRHLAIAHSSLSIAHQYGFDLADRNTALIIEYLAHAKRKINFAVSCHAVLDPAAPLPILSEMTLTNAQRQFLNAQRVGHLATADAGGVPHVTPVCYASAGANIYITIDDKPKRQQEMPLKRLRNIAENRVVRFVVDLYDDHDWSRLCWLMLRGQADILTKGDEHDEAQRLLRARYPQLREMAIERHPVIAIRVEHATSWGRLETSRS